VYYFAGICLPSGASAIFSNQPIVRNGESPKRLYKAPDPLCASCMYGSLTRRPWRTQTSPREVTGGKPITRPGDCVSVNQLQSPVPGHIAQTKGHPTRERYNGATVFADHYSDVTYVYLRKTLNAKDTLEAKEAFERWARSCGTTINHYHADNGRFAENEFMADVAKKGQTISFCGINAHFQNGKAERRIRSLSEQGRAQLLHAMARWPVAITHHLWPYAVANVASVMNDTAKKARRYQELKSSQKVLCVRT
jgi:hypothetical protein